MNINIRSAKIEDVPRLVDINVDSWQNTYDKIIDHDDLFSIDKTKRIQKMIQDFDKNNYLVACNDNEIMGFAWYRENENGKYQSEIVALYIDIKYRSLGVGKKLFDYVKDILKENNDNLIIWCLEENICSRKFYEKIGGKLVDEKNTINFCDKKYIEVGYIYNI